MQAIVFCHDILEMLLVVCYLLLVVVMDACYLCIEFAFEIIVLGNKQLHFDTLLF